jgi:hypothetical protein
VSRRRECCKARRTPGRVGRRSERGAVAIEAAMVTGVVFAMIFGILEMAFLMRDHVGVTSSARIGARAASTGAAAGPCVAEPEDEVQCPPNGVPELAQRAADAIASSRTVLPKDAIEYVMVYKASGAGGFTSAPDLAACNTNCVAYRWYPTQDRFRYFTGNWDSRTISGCAEPKPPGNVPLDAVGVQLLVEHEWLTGIFGESMDLSDSAVMSFEPLANAACAPGEHQ